MTTSGSSRFSTSCQSSAREAYEHSRLIAFRHEALSELFDRLSGHGFRFEVEEKAPFNGVVSDTLITLSSLMAKLTDRQVDAISAAYNCGYYQTPAG